MPRDPVSLAAYWQLVRSNTNFRRLWLAQIISEIGDWLYTIAIYSLLLELTGSAKSVALAVVLQVLPQFFIAPTAGVVNDRVSRKRVMIWADLARAVIVLGMLFASRGGTTWTIYALLITEALMWGFFEPGRTAVVPNITDQEEILAANGLSSMTWSFNLAAGSALGGAVAAYVGRDAVFVLNSLSFLLSAVLLSGMTFREPHVDRSSRMRVRDLVNFTPMVEGARYVARNREILATLLVKAGLGVVGTHWVLLPIFGERVFPVHGAGLDPKRGAMLAMSLLMGSRGVGALLGPLVSGYWAGQHKARMRAGIVHGFIAAAIGYFGLALAPSLPLACLAVVLAHAGVSVVWVFSTTLLQFQTEDRFRGRVFSADFACLVVAMAGSSYVCGVLADFGLGVRTLAWLTGAVALVPGLAWAAGLGRLRRNH